MGIIGFIGKDQGWGEAGGGTGGACAFCARDRERICASSALNPPKGSKYAADPEYCEGAITGGCGAEKPAAEGIMCIGYGAGAPVEVGGEGIAGGAAW